MRRTWNTSVSPTIGMVTAATGNIGFGPACAAAGWLRAAPASASAPVARMVLRSMVFMSVLLSAGFIVEGVSSRVGHRGQVSKKTRNNVGPHAHHHRTVSNDFNGLGLPSRFSSRHGLFGFLVCVWPDRDHFSQGKRAPITAR